MRESRKKNPIIGVIGVPVDKVRQDQAKKLAVRFNEMRIGKKENRPRKMSAILREAVYEALDKAQDWLDAQPKRKP